MIAIAMHNIPEGIAIAVPVFASTSESLSTMADAFRSASASDNSRSLSSDGLDVFGSFSINFALLTSKAFR